MKSQGAKKKKKNGNRLFLSKMLSSALYKHDTFTLAQLLEHGHNSSRSESCYFGPCGRCASRLSKNNIEYNMVIVVLGTSTSSQSAHPMDDKSPLTEV